MRSSEELSDLFTTYFSDRLSPSQIDCLVADTMTAVQNRRMRTYAVAEGAIQGRATAEARIESVA
jgi:hypothetical protein